MQVYLISFVIFVGINSSFARSGGAGNGGDAIVCGEEVMLLDSYEAQKLRLTLNLSNLAQEKQTWRSMVNVAVNRLRKKDKFTASILYDYAMEMVNDFEKFEMFPGARGKHVYLGYDILAEINDSDHVSTPDGCEEHPRQMVSQRVPRFKLDYRYEFSQSLWEKMTLLDQAMTILHEAWYRIMLEHKASSSVSTRYMNALIASEEFENYSFIDYIDELKGTEISEYIIQNTSEAIKDKKIIIKLQEHSFKSYDSGEICAPRFKIRMNIKETWRVFNQSQAYLANIKFQNVCFKNSALTRLVLPLNAVNDDTTLRFSFFQAQFSSASDKNPTFYFYDNGKLSHFSGIKFSSFMEMFYICNGNKSYTQKDACKGEKGPFINHDTKIKNPLMLKFDENERPLEYFLERTK